MINEKRFNKIESLKTLTEEELTAACNKAFEALQTQNDTAEKLITDFVLENLKITEVEPRIRCVDCSTEWSHDPDENVRARFTLGFKSEDERRDLDFGSSFDVTITNKRLNINYGCIGNWYPKTDKYQVAKVRALNQLIDMEDDLVTIVDNTLSLEVFQNYYDINSEFDRRDNEARKAKEKAEELEFIEKIKSSKFIYQVVSCWKAYPSNDTEKVISFSTFYEINKVTDKNVLVTECTYAYGDPTKVWRHENRRLSLTDVIYNLKKTNYVLKEELVPATGKIVIE